ncbi:unnamed protein product [Medioppia subpectinata]|uniref:Uncharacterized protein n=1 Tax=Medioppia subpectinata TaxID=1979941 RepID=A0A7R9KLX9_9ACAR|nr:unnamed protein product [Medioppia subpectinata]CAG2104692.1 unnamed protein product [Medioppia subpectinata]
MNGFGDNKRVDPRLCWYRLGNRFRKTVNKCYRCLHRNKELEDRLAELNCKQSNRDYNSMTSSVSVGPNPAKQSAESVSLGAEFRQMRPTLIATANAFLTIGGTFFFCYKAVEYSLPEPNISSQILSGLFGAMVVAVAEIYFLVRII